MLKVFHTILYHCRLCKWLLAIALFSGYGGRDLGTFYHVYDVKGSHEVDAT